MIPISKPDIGPAEEAAVLEVLRSGMLAMGRQTAAFEEAWAAYCGVRHAVLMSNGTVAQEAVLHALGIGPGDEVITVSFSFNATVSVDPPGRRHAGLRRRREPTTSAWTPPQVEAAITPRTKAIMPVHLYGLMADMDPLVDDRRAPRPRRSSRTRPRPTARRTVADGPASSAPPCSASTPPRT